MVLQRRFWLAAFFVVTLAFPSTSMADSWTFGPDDGATDVAQPVDVDTSLSFGDGETVDSMHADVQVVGGYNGMTHTDITTDGGGDDGPATFTGTVTFSPPPPAGTKVEISSSVVTSDFVVHSRTTTFTVK